MMKFHSNPAVVRNPVREVLGLEPAVTALSDKVIVCKGDMTILLRAQNTWKQRPSKTAPHGFHGFCALVFYGFIHIFVQP